MSCFSAAKQELEALLGEVEVSLSFIGDATKLRPRLGKLVAWDSLGDMKATVQSFCDQKEFLPSAIMNGAIVLVHGALERFIRRLARESIRFVDERTETFDKLHGNIVLANQFVTGRALGTVYQPLDFLDLNFETLCRNIGSCISGAKDFALNSDAFSLEVRDVSEVSIEKIAKHVGLKSVDWDRVATDGGMQAVIGKDNARPGAIAIKKWLIEFSQLRNRIAHNGAASRVIYDEDVREALLYSRVLSKGVASVLEDFLKKSYPKRR